MPTHFRKTGVQQTMNATGLCVFCVRSVCGATKMECAKRNAKLTETMRIVLSFFDLVSGVASIHSHSQSGHTLNIQIDILLLYVMKTSVI